MCVLNKENYWKIEAQIVMSIAGEPAKWAQKRQERGICRNCKLRLENCSWLSEKDSDNCHKPRSGKMLFVESYRKILDVIRM